MWDCASSHATGSLGMKKDALKCRLQDSVDCSDDDAFSIISEKGDDLECPICCESFNLVENIPYVLWCGHTLCKNCILGLHWAIVKFPTFPLQLPLFVSCPWCNLLSLRLVYKGNLKFPRKNFFLQWMLEHMNGDRMKADTSIYGDHQVVSSSSSRPPQSDIGNNLRRGIGLNNCISIENLRLNFSLRKSLVFFVNLTAKFPLVIMFLLIIVYAVPFSIAILILYILITVVFALPSFLVLYFAYPSLDWLVREMIA